MENAKMPTLDAGQIMVHDATRTIGQVVETIYPAENPMNGYQQVLSLLDGTQHKFPQAELRPANRVEARPFVLAVVE
jgi:hypothetical protein